MKKQKIKPLRDTIQMSMVKAYVDYFIRRAKRVMRLKDTDFNSYHINYYFRSKTIHIWFFSSESEIVAIVQFTSSGRLIEKEDYRNSGK